MATHLPSKMAAEITRLRDECRQALKLSKKIRYVGVINQYGRTLTGAKRPDARLVLRPAEAQNEFFLMSSLINMRSKSVRALGPLDHITLQHENAYVVLLKATDRVYYISIEPDVKGISNLILKIKKVLV